MMTTAPLARLALGSTLAACSSSTRTSRRIPSLLRAKIGDLPAAQANVLWEYDNASYSQSHLTELLRDTYALPIAGGGLNGYWY